MELLKFKGKEVSVLVWYGFKKKTKETQSYGGKLISNNKLGIVLEWKIGYTSDIVVNDFFPWYNIYAICYLLKDYENLSANMVRFLIKLRISDNLWWDLWVR